MTLHRFATPLAFMLCAVPAASAQWTQFGGPERNFHAPAGKLAPAWPASGPPVTWRRPFGDGYSGILVEEDRLYTLFRRAGNEVATALSRRDGTTLWEHEYPVVTTHSAQQFGDGPSSTPVLSGDRLVTVGVGLDICCLDKESGELLWYRDVMEEFDIPMPGRGYSPSPIVFEDLVILPVGGTADSMAIDDTPNLGFVDGAVVAFELETGIIVWASQNFPGSKASPLLIHFGDRPQVVVFMANELAGLDPRNGELLWRVQHATDYGFNCSTPVWDGVDTLICTSSYGNQAEAVQLTHVEGRFEAKRKWASRRLSIHITNMLLVNDRLYGASGMTKPGFITCLDAETGKMLWRSREFSKANLVYAGGPFIVYDEDGQLALVTFEDDGDEPGPRVHGRVEVTDSHAFTAPTLVGTDLYVRDRRNLTAFDLSAEAIEELSLGKRRAFEPEVAALPEDYPDLLGAYESDSTGAEPARLRVFVKSGWLTLDLEDKQIRLAPQSPTGRWEFVEDRTTGSTPRTLQLTRDSDGQVSGFVLCSPSQRERTYLRVR